LTEVELQTVGRLPVSAEAWQGLCKLIDLREILRVIAAVQLAL